ncbi:MAG: FAD-dependent oxidoreductase, partial [Lachnospiraceae bacterium]|nr:FAD-dependent oxidoreductase [Lachnospiraceae bacterium]
MITINQIKTEIRFNDSKQRLELKDMLDSEDVLRKKAARILGVAMADVSEIIIQKHSIDARKKPQLFHVYTLGVTLKNKGLEEKTVKRCRNNNVLRNTQNPYRYPASGQKELTQRPVIIGMGPAGLFCGYMLAKHGYKPVLLERGFDVETRTKDVEAYWNGGSLNAESNVQFGEGGAGTFSDGKLNTLVKDKSGRNREVLRIFAEFGAPEQILYESKPHIGT